MTLMYVRLRFKKVNEIITIRIRKRSILKCTSGHDVKLIKEVTDRLYHLCRMHYKLCHLMRELNKTFAFQLLCSLAVSMGDVLFQSYYLYHLLFNSVPNVTTTMVLCPIAWLVDEMVEIFLLVRSCASTCESANTTPILLHEFRNELDNIEIESHIQMYSLQLLHQKIRVSALGFFYIDYSLIYSVVGAVTTYLVIFIQFDQQTSDIKLYPVGNCSGP
ncbi:putative gustatory receptor 28b [Anoplophora glabripennis]|uniref:putative gustatory receptor 28b n=1 Tax=Anoplophora glabripennis TaxID=217634 RepID=UPI000C7928C8|nr:putative gustatory receptor 28b [Anoplophora glabripennis]